MSGVWIDVAGTEPKDRGMHFDRPDAAARAALRVRPWPWR
jgi:hypothetical protein